MQRARATYFLSLAALIFAAGCGVKHNFPAPQIASRVSLENKLPLKVAVYADPEFTFGYPRIAKLEVFTEVMNPGLADTLHNAFNSDFHAVFVIDRQTAVAFADADLIAAPSLNLSHPINLTLLFSDR